MRTTQTDICRPITRSYISGARATTASRAGLSREVLRLTDEEVEARKTGEYKGMTEAIDFYARPPVPIRLVPRPNHL